MKKEMMRQWLCQESTTYSRLTGERFSHGEVLKANAVTLGIIAVAVVAGSLLG